jgi:hypothetical protein
MTTVNLFGNARCGSGSRDLKISSRQGLGPVLPTTYGIYNTSNNPIYLCGGPGFPGTQVIIYPQTVTSVNISWWLDYTAANSTTLSSSIFVVS